MQQGPQVPVGLGLGRPQADRGPVTALSEVQLAGLSGRHSQIENVLVAHGLEAAGRLEMGGRLRKTASVHKKQAEMGRSGRFRRMQSDSLSEPGLSLRPPCVLQYRVWLTQCFPPDEPTSKTVNSTEARGHHFLWGRVKYWATAEFDKFLWIQDSFLFLSKVFS